MTSIPVPASSPIPHPAVSPQALSKGRAAFLLAATAFLAFSAYYFVGIDEGMVKVTGNAMAVHELVHDARHLLGFPCH
jgi:hypothetical protein